MRKKMNKRTALTAASCAMLGIAAVGGTLAYLTDSETATNTFTVGKVKHELEEPNFPGNGKMEAMQPNEEVKKDPQVENTGKNDMVSFLRVFAPVANVAVVGKDGKGLTRDQSGAIQTSVQEIFNMKRTADKIGTDGNKFNTVENQGKWIRLESKEKDPENADNLYYELYTDPDTHKESYRPINADAAKTKLDAATPKNTAKIFKAYVFGYQDVLKPHDKTQPVFDKVQLRNVIEGELDLTKQDIVIESYAIQAQNILENENAAIDVSTLDVDKLGKIYDVFVN